MPRISNTASSSPFFLTAHGVSLQARSPQCQGMSSVRREHPSGLAPCINHTVGSAAGQCRRAHR
jgi:hypothetical protein